MKTFRSNGISDSCSNNRKSKTCAELRRSIEHPKLVGIVALVVAFVLCGVAAEAQQTSKVYRIGFLSGGFPGPDHWTARLRAELQKLGYAEGKNIVIEACFTENHVDRLPRLADEIVRLKPDVIATGGINDARAAKNATNTIPIVGTSLGNPTANGLVESLARPGGNLTGFTSIVDELAGKRLELLKETVSNLSRVDCSGIRCFQTRRRPRNSIAQLPESLICSSIPWKSRTLKCSSPRSKKR